MKTKLIILLLLFIPLSLVHAEDEIVAYKLTSKTGCPTITSERLNRTIWAISTCEVDTVYINMMVIASMC